MWHCLRRERVARGGSVDLVKPCPGRITRFGPKRFWRQDHRDGAEPATVPLNCARACAEYCALCKDDGIQQSDHKR